MSSKVHVTKPLSSKLIIELLDENPDLEEINCPLSLYERTSEIYLDALAELGIVINIIESRGRPKKYDDDLKEKIDEMLDSGLSVKTIASKLNISSKTVYYLKKNKLKQGPKSKYSNKTKKEIFDMRNEGIPVKKISEKMNIPIRTIYYILKNNENLNEEVN
ncbi:MAG: helix-turn-helix domain-containing protein [Methanosphaera sp.]|nr:helix-turn-helix domain-containing protein [Methanosphaera sp.]